MKIAVLAIATLIVASAHAADSTFPMHAGDTWTYDAKVDWTVANSNQTKSATVPWRMKIVDVVEGPKARAAIVEGLLLRLAWYDPTAQETPAFDVIVVRPDGVWIDSETSSRDDARAIAARAVAGETVGHQLLQFPLHEKDCVDSEEDPDRHDGNYCWLLMHDDTQANAKAWRIGFATLPDHQILYFTEGVGFTGYSYVHHGTVASADAVLRRKSSHGASVRRTP